MRWGLPLSEDLDFGVDIRDPRVATLGGILATAYTYDFGDEWHHTIKVERRTFAELWERYPSLVDAKDRAA